MPELLAVSNALGHKGISDPVPSWVPDWRNLAKFHVPPFMNGQPSFGPPGSTCHLDSATNDQQSSRPYAKHQDTTIAASWRAAILSCLNLWELPVDVHQDDIILDLATTAGIRLLRERMSKWKCNNYCSVCGSLNATFLKALVSHSFFCEEQALDSTDKRSGARQVSLALLRVASLLVR